MQRNSTQAIEQAWDHLAGEYAREIGPAGKRAPLAAIEMAAILREIPAGATLKILDAGGGGGHHAVGLARLGHSVTIVDISSRMLGLAAEAARDAGVESRGRYLKGDIRDLAALSSEVFDMVISCGTVISDCGSPLDAVRSFRSVLRDRGKACFSVRSVSSVRLRDDATETAGTDPRVRVIPGHQAFDWHLFSLRGTERLCAEAGLRLLRVVPVACEAPPPTGQERRLKQYAETHLQRTDDEGALQQAVELIAER